MLKVVVVVDKQGTAIDRLAQGMSKFMDNIDYKIVDVHPKRPDQQQLAAFESAAIDADIIDWQYFRTAEMLRNRYDWLKDKKQILTHHNPYSIDEQTWDGYNLVIANNQTIYKRLGNITHAPLELIYNAIDTDFWTFNQDWGFDGRTNHAGKYEWKGEDAKPSVIMVANRIESKKGILPVAIAAADAGMKFILVGAISDPQYFQSIMATGGVEYHEQISDEALRDLYYKSTIHVCNSKDNFESGTLPILEAMICGTPVLTREIGIVPDIYNGDNLRVMHLDPDESEKIQKELESMLYDKKQLLKQRDAAWNTAKTMGHERRAYQYQKLYRQVLFDTTPVSIILPIFNNPEIVRKNLNAIASQTYKNIEVIVVDDMPSEQPSENKLLVDDFKKYVSFPVRYIYTASSDHDYGLARARNEGVIEATGDIVIFIDQRMIPEPDAVEQFVFRMKPKHWIYGNKGGKKEFVENFSAVYRQDVINAGLFNERINLYGGQSQEIRSRIRQQGFQIEYVENAKAIPTGKSSNRNRKRSDIIKMKNRLYKMGLS